MINPLRALVFLCLGAILAGCDAAADLEDPPVDLGPFQLGHNIVVVPEPAVLPGSMKVTEKEWQDAITKATDARFGRYEGPKLYHLGISVDAYLVTSLDAGVPGVPSLKSVVALNVTLWDDTAQKKLNEKPKRITAISAFSGDGPFPTKDKILTTLSARAAKNIESWLLDHPEWFDCTKVTCPAIEPSVEEGA